MQSSSSPQRQREESHSGQGLPTGVSYQAVLAQLDKILVTPLFAHSDRLTRFLRFVVQETLEGRGAQLKEYHVGLAVFDRDESFDPRADPIVRVEAGRLREKLAKYYEVEGARDSIVISLPRGSYVAKVRGPASGVSRLHLAKGWLVSRLDRKTCLLILTSVMTVVLSISVLLLISRNRRIEEQLRETKAETKAPLAEPGPVWAPFFDASSPIETVIVVGSPLFFSSEPDRLFLRLYSVNDPEEWQNHPDYQKLQKLFPSLSKPRFDYAEMGDALALQKLTAFFGQNGRSVKATPVHLTSWDAIKNGNIIFLGPSRFNPLMRRLPEPLDFELSPDYFTFLNLRPRPGEPKVYSTPSHRDAQSFTVVASFPGLLNNRRIMVLTSHSTAGTLAAVEYVTRPETLQEMVAKLGLTERQLRSYQVLLKVLSDKDEPFKTEFVTHHSTPLK
ncbi:MAG: hypothetical protein ACE15E_08705 [Acidobacteriota bacterium]